MNAHKRFKSVKYEIRPRHGHKAVKLAIDSATEDLSDPDSNLFTANRLLAINHEGGYFELTKKIPRFYATVV